MSHYEIRMNRFLYTLIHDDLNRPHLYAAERVGFAFGRLSSQDTIYLNRYLPVPDERYLQSFDFGALIDDQAILAAMQELRSHRGEGICCLHVHRHEHVGHPRFSRDDLRGLPGLIPSFQRMEPVGAHGCLLFSHNQATAWIWSPQSDSPFGGASVVVSGRRLLILGQEREEPNHVNI